MQRVQALFAPLWIPARIPANGYFHTVAPFFNIQGYFIHHTVAPSYRFDRTAYSFKCPPFRSSALSDLANSRKAVSIACRRVCPVIIVIRERSAAADGDSIVCNLVNNVPSGSLSARSLYRRCRSVVLIGPTSRPPFSLQCNESGGGPSTVIGPLGGSPPRGAASPEAEPPQLQF